MNTTQATMGTRRLKVPGTRLDQEVRLRAEDSSGARCRNRVA